MGLFWIWSRYINSTISIHNLKDREQILSIPLSEIIQKAFGYNISEYDDILSSSKIDVISSEKGYSIAIGFVNSSSNLHVIELDLDNSGNWKIVFVDMITNVSGFMFGAFYYIDIVQENTFSKRGANWESVPPPSKTSH